MWVLSWMHMEYAFNLNVSHLVSTHYFVHHNNCHSFLKKNLLFLTLSFLIKLNDDDAGIKTALEIILGDYNERKKIIEARATAHWTSLI